MAINKFSANEALNIQLGQNGSVYESGTTAVSAPTGKKIVAIMAIADAVFATLTPENNSYMGRTSTASEYNGDAFSDTFKQGDWIYGSWNNFTLSSGKVIAYFG
jgi:hypothetical protein|tara:strand:+ start:772 stop:1083 length:312 start_codon:yes stop_codon:yes gene_type:complete